MASLMLKSMIPNLDLLPDIIAAEITFHPPPPPKNTSWSKNNPFFLCEQLPCPTHLPIKTFLTVQPFRVFFPLLDGMFPQFMNQ